MQLLETGGKRLLQNSQLEAPSRNSCSGDGAAERDPKGRGGEFVPKKPGKSHNSPGICCSRCLREGRSCSRRILGAPKETTPFPASGMSQGEAGSAHPTGIPAGSSFDPGPAPAIPAAAFPPSQGSRGILPVFAPGMFPLDPPHPALFLPSFQLFPGRSCQAQLLHPGWGWIVFPKSWEAGEAVELLRALHFIPKGHSQGSFPGLIPRAHSQGSFHPPGSICSSPVRIKALPRRLGADGSSQRIPPFFSLSAPPPWNSQGRLGKSSGIRF